MNKVRRQIARFRSSTRGGVPQDIQVWDVEQQVGSEELSLCSTHTAVDQNKQLVPETVDQAFLQRPHRTVQFDENKNVSYGRPVYPSSASIDPEDEEDWTETWYTSAEYHQMKENHKKNCRKFYRKVMACLKKKQDHQDQHIDALMAAYASCDRGFLSSCLVEAIGVAAAEVSETTSVTDRLGLEPLVIHAGFSHGTKQIRRQRLVEQAVYLCVPENYSYLSSNQLSELIAERCQHISRPSRLFALALGQANAQEYQ